jgi:hypothetical protein
MRALFLGPSENLTVTACENDAAPFSKQCAHSFSSPSQNFAETAWQNDAALFLKDNARIVF